MSEREPAPLTTDDLVTGEAVAIDLPAAGLAVRLVSGLLDVVATLVVLLVVLLLGVLATARTDAALVHVAQVGTFVVAFLAFPTALETLTRGKSLGKLAMGLRTVRDDGGPISFQHAFTRALVGVVEIYLLSGAPAFFAVLLDTRGKRLGDHAAGTRVVRERVRLVLPYPAPVPHQLAGWARSADLAPLPTGLALGVRQYLARAGTLEPGARDHVGLALARQVLPLVAPPPPPGTPPAAFLAAVVGARRERDQARLAREADLRHRLTSRW